MSFKKPAISRSKVTLEKQYALRDVSATIQERGHPIEIRLHTESTVQRDRLNSIKKRTSTTKLSFYAYPLVFNPTDKELDRAGIRERTQVIAHTAMFDWNEEDFDMKRLESLDSIRATVIINNQKYEIKEKSLFSEFSDTYLYVVLGLNKI